MIQRDIKLLWGRAGNRCAFCRVELTQDAVSVNSAFVLGEQAHIVGEKEGAPRGKSLLSEEERESYHNRILLCPTHHTEIDKNEADWPVEKLHHKKSAHELWVREALSDSGDIARTARQLAVASIVDSAVLLCDLPNWKYWTSNALASDPHWAADAPERLFEFRQRVAAAIWPEDAVELRRATETLAILIHRAIEKFREHSVFEGDRYWPRKFYREGGFNPNYDRDLDRYKAWLDECWRLVKEATKAANWFADVVRRDVNPLFFIEHGRFLINEEGFSIVASIPQFTADEKAQLPGALLEPEA